jgi:hypothetical protein
MMRVEASTEAPSASWLDRCLAARDGLLASPRFRRWAAAFPLTRPIARRRTRDLFDLCAGFVYSQVLYACVRLRLFEILAEGPQGTGLAVRGMPVGSPGMEIEGSTPDTFDVVLFGPAGRSVFERYEGARRL